MRIRRRRRWRRDASRCPNAEKYYNEVMSIPLYYGLTDEDVEDVIHAVKKVVAYYTKLK
jgi:dTDP-4-amino-4,6-dideoxygalactose transaminase